MELQDEFEEYEYARMQLARRLFEWDEWDEQVGQPMPHAFKELENDKNRQSR
ncbi:MAG: hypothetical protein WAU89_17980 [Candidatus Acidiferrales bacterium]